MANSPTKSLSIGNTLRHRLRVGHLRAGERFYSNSSLARDFGISSPTASKILDELCSEGLVHRVPGSGTFVSDTAIRPITDCYVVIASFDTYNPLTFATLCYEMVRDFEHACSYQGARADLVNVIDPGQLNLLDQLLAEGVSGALLLPPYEDALSREAYRRLQAHKVPCAYWDTAGGDSMKFTEDSVRHDNRQGGVSAAQHLIALGHRQLAFIGHSKDLRWQRDRLAGCQEALADGGLPEAAVRLVSADCLRPTVLSGILAQLFGAGCTGLIVANDTLAVEVVAAAKILAKQCSEDYSIVGFDNRQAALFSGLTTVDLPSGTIAQAAFAMLSERAKSPDAPLQTQTVPCTLIVRRSTGVPPSPE